MSKGARLAALLIGGGMLAGGVVLLAPPGRPGIALVVLGALILLSLACESRYRTATRDSAPQGPGWEQTGETFRDEETGRWVRVWYHPATGQRRYVAQQGPR